MDSAGTVPGVVPYPELLAEGAEKRRFNRAGGPHPQPAPEPAQVALSVRSLPPAPPELVPQQELTPAAPGSLQPPVSVRQLQDEDARRARALSYQAGSPFFTQVALRHLEIAQKARALLAEGRVMAARRLLQAAEGEPTTIVPLERLREILGPPAASLSPVTDRDRSEEFRWLARHRSEHRGKWVALRGSSLVAAADSLKELRQELSRLKLPERPLVHHLD